MASMDACVSTTITKLFFQKQGQIITSNNGVHCDNNLRLIVKVTNTSYI